MTRNLILALVGTALLSPSCCAAQKQAVTAHFDIERKAGKGESKKASEVVMWLSPVGNNPGISLPRDSRPPRLVQKNKSFSPHLLVIAAGSAVEFPNRDPFFHNVFSLFEGKRFDLGLYEAGGTRTVRFDRPGVSYIFCNIHPDMSAVVVAVDTPYYGISNAAGDVVIPNVPDGEYVLHIWSESGKPEELQALTRRVSVSAASHFLGRIHVTQTQGLAVTHNNKYGQSYETPDPSSPVYTKR